MQARALVAMSGGVDSSVAAHLARQAGFECVGATMKLVPNAFAGEDGAGGKTCCAADDVRDAKAVARRLGFPHYVFNFTEAFSKQVIGRFAAAYAAGETPNPCVECNRRIKFEKLLLRARQMGAETLVTGHYARIEQGGDGRFLLRAARDEAKDQSYFLCTLTQGQLAHTLLPLGGFAKEEVRALALSLGLVTAAKRDSQDICFVPGGSLPGFFEAHAPNALRPGYFVDEEGRRLGRHRGVALYTLGQRRGIGLALAKPMYVTHLSPQNNTVTLGENRALFSRGLLAKNVNFIAQPSLSRPLRVTAKIRSAQRAQGAWAEQTAPCALRLTFDEPQRAITPGQTVALYQDGYVVAGGTIAGVCE